ncbi:WapI family immunity protein [Streptomyces sp. NPDC002690]
MILGAGASRVELRPLRRQFAEARGNRYDDNWLIIGCKVTTPGGSWSFADPALLIHEAHQVTDWLRGVAAGSIAPCGPDEAGYLSPDTWFVEPVLAFSLADRGEGGLVLRVHLSLEARPPVRQGEDEPDFYQYYVQVRTDAAGVLRAADEWDRALAAFPPR